MRLFSFSFLLLFSFPLFSQLEIEPNDEIDSSTTIQCNSFIEGYIQDVGDVDWFTIDISSAGTIEVQVYNVASGLDLDLGIYKVVNNQPILVSDDGDSNSSSGQELSTIAYLTSGIYFIKVHDENNNGSNGSEPYTLNIICAENQLEVNQTIDLASPIPLDTCFNDNIWGSNECYFDSNEGANDQDWFRVEIIETGILNVDVTSVPSNIDLDLGIYQIVNNQAKRISNDGDTNANGGQDVTTTAFVEQGTYYVRVNDENNNATNQETYNFCIGFYPNQFEINQTYELAAVIPFDTCFEENIWGQNECYLDSNNDSNDKDWFQVEIMESGILSSSVFSVPSNIDLDLSIHKVANNQLTRISNDGDTNSETGQSLSTAAFVDSGIYYILINDENSNATNQEPYSFCIEFSSHAFEINQTFEAAALIPSDTCFEESIWGQNECYFDSNFGSNDRDWFKVNLLESGTLNAEVSSVPFLLDLNIAIFEIKDNLLNRVSDDDEFDAGGGQSVSSTAYLNAGEYYILIHDENDNWTMEETFNFCVEFFPNEFEINQTIELAARIPRDTCFKEDQWGENENFPIAGLAISFDLDWFEIEIEEECLFKASATNVPLLIQPDLKIYELIDGQAVMVAEDDVSNASAGQSVFLETNLNEGTYYLLFADEFLFFTDRETFDLCVSCEELVNNNEEVGLENEIYIYPNPVVDVLHIEIESWNEYSKVSILDTKGKKVAEKNVFNQKSSIDISGLPKGMYFIQLKSAKGFTTKKFIKG